MIDGDPTPHTPDTYTGTVDGESHRGEVVVALLAFGLVCAAMSAKNSDVYTDPTHYYHEGSAPEDALLASRKEPLSIPSE